MKNMNFLLVIFLIVILSCVLYAKLNKVKVAQLPPVIDDSGVIQEPELGPKEPIKEPIKEPKVEFLVDAKNYNEALKMAKEHKKPIFILFGANWCLWCKELTKTVSEEEIKKKLATEYVVYFVDTDKHKTLVRKYGIYGIPVSMIIDADENVLAKASGSMSKEEFVKFLNDRPNEKPKERKFKKVTIIEHLVP